MNQINTLINKGIQYQTNKKILFTKHLQNKKQIYLEKKEKIGK